MYHILLWILYVYNNTDWQFYIQSINDNSDKKKVTIIKVAITTKKIIILKGLKTQQDSNSDRKKSQNKKLKQKRKNKGNNYNRKVKIISKR